MKKIFTLFMAVLICAGMSSRAERVQIGELYYNLNAEAHTASVTWSDDSDFFTHNYPNLFGIDVVVPDTVLYNAQKYAVTEIGENAFDIAEMISITLPQTINHIGELAFGNTHNLEYVILPDNQVYVERDAFMNSGLYTFTLPAGWNTFDYNIFGTCDNLSVLKVAEGNPRFDSRDNCNAIIETSTNTLLFGCKNTVIPNSVTAIAEYAFWNHKNLLSINLPNGIKTIGTNAFQDCIGLTSLSIPASLESFDETTFSGCINLETIVVDPANTHFDSRNNCNAIIETATNTLRVGSVNTDIPQTVTTIGQNAFALMQRLDTIVIPSSVTRIEQLAYYWCKGLKSITCKAATPPTLGFNVFGEDSVTLIQLHVPCTSVDVYQSTVGWSQFTNISSINSETHSGDVNDNIHWDLDCAGVLTVSGTGAIPGYTKMSYAPWSIYKHLITSIVVAEGITRVGNYAFNELSKATYATLASTVDSIGNSVFNSCISLVEVELQSIPRSIGSKPFYGCSHLNKIWCPCNGDMYGYGNGDELMEFYEKLYRKCDNERPVFFGACGTSVDGRNLTWRFENDLLTITGSGAMADYIVEPDYNATPWMNLSEFVGRISLPDGLTVIGANAFMGFEKVQTVTIPSSVISINEDAFNACTSMNDIYMSTPAENLTWVDDAEDVFADFKPEKATICYLPTQAMKEAYEAKFASVNVTFAVDENAAPQACSDDKQGTFGTNNSFSWLLTCEGTLYVMGSGVMPNFGYRGTPWNDKMNDIKAVVIADGITAIGMNAFQFCGQLESASIPESVTEIKMSAFQNCTKLTSIQLPNSLITIGSSCFTGSGLTSLHIPANVTSIGNNAFGGCNSLRTITVDPANPLFDSRDNCNAIIQTLVNKLVVACPATQIPTSVTALGSYSYSEMPSLTSFEIPNHITKLEGSPFNSCSNLRSIYIPASVVDISREVGITSSCGNLESLVVAPGNPKFDSRDNCNAIIETATNKLKAGCVNTVIPDGVKIIDVYALYAFWKIKGLTIPASVDSIASAGLSILSGLDSLIVLAVNPPKLAGGTPLYSINRSIPLYVPAESVAAYQNAPTWMEFTNYRPITNSYYVLAVANHGSVNGTGVYTANSVIELTPVPEAGFMFMQWSDGTNDNPKSLTVTKDTTIRALFVKEEQVQQAIEIGKTISDDVKEITITFAPVEDATLYELKVYKSGKLVATVKLDADGNIVGEIQWAAPSRMKIRKVENDAEPNLYHINLSNLEFGQEYTFTLDAYNEQEECISAQVGTFNVQEADTPTDTNAVQQTTLRLQKVLRNGQLLIIRDGNTYTAQGQEVK